jgi:hypothetical protein
MERIGPIWYIESGKKYDIHVDTLKEIVEEVAVALHENKKYPEIKNFILKRPEWTLS